MPSTHLTIGAVARRAGVTVRTLHHYDSIGLVCPGARSESGYRLYSAEDIQRLHAVQSLKQLGLSLDAIAATLSGRGVTPQQLLAGQIAEAARVQEEARVLREKLQFLEQAVSDKAASPDDLLEGIRLLETHQRYLSGGGSRQLLARWRRARKQWQPIADVLERCRAQAESVDTAQVQLLAQRWMNVTMQVFQGRLAVILEWARMHREAPEAALHAGLAPALIDYLERAIALRLAALQRHLTPQELNRLDGTTAPAWEAFAARGEQLLARGVPPHAKAARALLGEYRELAARTVRHDPALAARLAQAHASEPLLAQGHFVTSALRKYLDTVPA